MISATPRGAVARIGGTRTSAILVSSRRSHWLRAVLACAAMAACEQSSVTIAPVPGDDPVIAASTLQATGGDAQEGIVGHALSQPLVVRIVAEDGSPLSGIPISWDIVQGRGSSRGQSGTDFLTTTAADGTSSIDWELGTAAGVQQVWAEVALTPTGGTSPQGVAEAPGNGNGNGNNRGKKVGFTATAKADVIQDVVVSPTDPNIETGGTLDFQAVAQDKWGNPLTASTWRWSSSNQSVASVDGNGKVVGLSEGSTEITAQTDGISGSQTLSVWTATPSDATIQKEGGDGQTGVVATNLTQPLGVRVVDGTGQPYAGLMLRWVFADGSGSSSEGSGQSFYAHTDAQGRSSATWTLGTTSGAQSAYAEIVVAGDGSGATRRVTFTSQASPDRPARIVLSRSSLSLQVGSSASVTATVVDRFGNEIPDANVTWSSSDPSVATVTESAPAGTGSSGAS